VAAVVTGQPVRREHGDAERVGHPALRVAQVDRQVVAAGGAYLEHVVHHLLTEVLAPVGEQGREAGNMDVRVVVVGLALVEQDPAQIAEHAGSDQSLSQAAAVGVDPVRRGVVALEEPDRLATVRPVDQRDGDLVRVDQAAAHPDAPLADRAGPVRHVTGRVVPRPIGRRQRWSERGTRPG
jgi:hypothetical protein